MLAVQHQPGENLGSCSSAAGAVAARRGGDQREGHGLAGLRRAWREFADVPGRRALSYGQSKLLSLARVLATEADVLLLDEPASGHRHQVGRHHARPVEAVREQGRTVCIVEHNLHVVGRLADHTYFMELGRITAAGHDRRAHQHTAAGGGLLWQPPDTSDAPADGRPTGRLLLVEHLQCRLRPQAGGVRRRPARQRGRDRRRPRPQRQRQEHDDQDDPRRPTRPRAARIIYRGQDVTKPGRAANVQGGHGADPVGALRVRRPHRARQPAARRGQRARSDTRARAHGAGLRAVPDPEGARRRSSPARCRAASSAW